MENIYIKFQDESDSWEHSIRDAAEILLQEGVINNNYIEKMIENVKQLGDYIVLVPKVAMPHARPEDGALGTGLSILKLSKPVIFNDAGDVYLLFCLATKDSKAHLEMLARVSQLIDNDEKVEELIQTKTEAEFIQVCKEYIGGD